MTKKFLLTLSIVLISLNAFSEIIYQRYKDTNEYTIIIKEVNAKDEVDFEKLVERIKSQKIKLHMNSIQLDSAGGVPSVAMQIGRVIRKNEFNTYIHPNAICNSACIFMLIGGVIRMPYGQVSVHRPIFTVDEIKKEPIRTLQADFKRRVGIYVEEMNVSDLLADAIIHTANWNTRILKIEEMQNWEVGGIDAVTEEYMFREYGKKLKISNEAFSKKYFENFDFCRHKAVLFEELAIDCVAKIKN